jgi:hypothetical protein
VINKVQIIIKPYDSAGAGAATTPLDPNEIAPFPRGVGQFVQFEPGGGLYSLLDGQWVRAPAPPAGMKGEP